MALTVTTAVRYGARAMTELASADPAHAMTVREVSKQQRISTKYLEHILEELRTAGLIRATRGRHGGYALAKPAERITLKDIYECLEGKLSPVECVNCPEACPMHDTCPTRDTWVEIKESMNAVLVQTTIRDLVERKRRKAISSAQAHPN
jgi:Rrf2 family protein